MAGQPVAATIVAIASAAGSGGIGVVRLSGSAARAIGERVCGRRLRPRRADHARFKDAGGETIDDGIVLYFRAPASFTGEDVVELQAHGSPVVLRQLVERCIALGAQQAGAGEFSQRAFLNGKLDLAQAEAIADLIAASDLRAARAARRSLEGVFSRQVEALMAQVLAIRVHAEAAIDFADEPLAALGGAELRARLETANAELARLLEQAGRGRRLRDGLHGVIVGPPNAGKSSLLNALAGSDRAIVTAVAGTTRDTLEETLSLDGVALTLVDTAGLRESKDAIEAEGIRRARAELARADLALAVVDARTACADRAILQSELAEVPEVLWLYNKTDLLTTPLELPDGALAVSARTGDGLEALREHLRALAGVEVSADGGFSARSRHLEALVRARDALAQAGDELAAERLELAADSLQQAHVALGEIGGRIDADGLLGHIFATFCIGK